MAEKRKADDVSGINWQKSAARAMILDDLASGELPLEDNHLSTDEAWDYYSSLHEFKDVPFSQFARQLQIHRERLARKIERSEEQHDALLRDRSKHSKPTKYENNRPIFRYSDAYAMLSGDVYNGRHLGLTPTAFRATRPEYQQWDLKEFTQRIYQMERQSKFINYMSDKRQHKEDEAKAAKDKAYEAWVKEEEQKTKRQRR